MLKYAVHHDQEKCGGKYRSLFDTTANVEEVRQTVVQSHATREVCVPRLEKAPQLAIDTNFKELFQKNRQFNGVKGLLNNVKADVLVSTFSDMCENSFLCCIDGVSTRLIPLVCSFGDQEQGINIVEE